MADMTHSEGCFRWHHGCAIAEVERLRAEVAEHLLRADSLRAELARQQDENERLHDELHLGQDEAKRLRAAVQAIRDLRDETEVRNHTSLLWQRLNAALGGEQ